MRAAHALPDGAQQCAMLTRTARTLSIYEHAICGYVCAELELEPASFAAQVVVS